MKFKVILRKLVYALEDASEAGKINEVEKDYLFNLSEEMKEKMRSLRFEEKIIDLYDHSNGIIIKWRQNPEEGVMGQLNLLRIETTLQDWSNKLYYESDLEENDLLEYYKPFDEVTPEVTSGFLITPEFTSDTIYTHYVSRYELHDLEIDFAGYLEKAIAAKVFNLWTRVLLQIQEGTEGHETLAFKEHMPKIFPDFSWEDFVEKYQNLRLSNQAKED